MNELNVYNGPGGARVSQYDANFIFRMERQQQHPHAFDQMQVAATLIGRNRVNSPFREGVKFLDPNLRGQNEKEEVTYD